jgi:hypothetical protein
MMHRLVGSAQFYALLLTIDRNLAEQVRREGCPCRGRLHRADYPRSPRGGPPDLPAGYGKRLSFCCAVEGCRKRATPPSVRFLGRRWYLSPIVVLISALQHGVTPRRLRAIQGWLERPVSRRTLERWRRWWREAFPASPFWQAWRGGFVPTPAEGRLPLSLIERFVEGPAETRLARILRFLSPMTTASCAHMAMGPPRR